MTIVQFGWNFNSTIYKVGFLFQNYALIDRESVDKNLVIALKFNTPEKNKRELKKEVLSKVGLVEKL